MKTILGCIAFFSMLLFTSGCAFLAGTSFSQPVRDKKMYAVKKIADPSRAESDIDPSILIPNKLYDHFKVSADSSVSFSVRVNNRIDRMYAMGLIIPVLPTYMIRDRGFISWTYCDDMAHHYLDSELVSMTRSDLKRCYACRKNSLDSFRISSTGDTTFYVYRLIDRTSIEKGNCADLVIDLAVINSTSDSFAFDPLKVLLVSPYDTIAPWSVSFTSTGGVSTFVNENGVQTFPPVINDPELGHLTCFRLHYTVLYPTPRKFTLVLPEVETHGHRSKELHVTCKRRDHLGYGFWMD
jgi:hypothetical protein